MPEQSEDRVPRPSLTAEILKDALTVIDPEMLARVIGTSVEQLEQWANLSVPMGFTERLGATMAVITLAPAGSDLFRRAARMRQQLAASLEFEQGTTSTSTNMPRFRFRT